MSRNRHQKINNHPKPNKTLIDAKSPYSPNSIGGRIDLESLRDKLFSQEQTKTNTKTITNHNTNESKNSQTSLQAKGEEK